MSATHGNTPAAWTAVALILLAFVIGALAVAIGNWPLFWIGGVGFAIVGAIVGKVMQMMGLGQKPKSARSAGTQSAGTR